MEKIEIIKEMPIKEERMRRIISEAAKEPFGERSSNMSLYKDVIGNMVTQGYIDNLEARIWLNALNNPLYQSI